MKCRVFLVGEGPTDIGDLVELPSYRQGREGFLQPLLRQMAVGGVALDFFDGRKLTLLKRSARREPPQHLQTRKAAQALALASTLGADALVYSCDVDKSHGAANAAERRRRLRDIRESIEAGFTHARDTDPAAAQVLTAAAVPARMIEAWALGDREALAALLDTDAARLTYRPPEELWGDESDPASNHPKCVWRRVTDGQLEHAAVGARARPHTLEQACPESFVPFARDVDAALASCRARRAR